MTGGTVFRAHHTAVTSKDFLASDNMSSDISALGSSSPPTGVPRISIEGPDGAFVDAGKDTRKAKPGRAKPSPGLLEAGIPSGSNLKRRNIGNGSDNTNIPPRRSPTTATDAEQPGWFQALLHPKQDPEALQAPPIGQCLLNIIRYSYLNVLLLMIPIGWAVHFAHLSDTLIFVFNFLSIIPLAALLGFATEELALRVGPTLGGASDLCMSALDGYSLTSIQVSSTQRFAFHAPGGYVADACFQVRKRS